MAKVSLRAYNREIETMLDRGQWLEVIAHSNHILKTFPKHLETYRLLGKAYLEMKKYGDAVDIFSRILVSAPNDFVSHVGMSIIRDEENKLDDAIWHMERAFETQPSNAAIQSELQRLYSRRDGVAPPRIRMTRGALAHMYVKGELYPQAISEIKNVLKEDGGRSDMQALLAIAHYKSGQKNEAADVASALLRRYPYCYDANAVLIEILGTDRPETIQAYRQRVVELDPYAAHVTSSLLQTADAPENAVALERYEGKGEELDASWRDARGIRLDSEVQPVDDWRGASGFNLNKESEQPAWLTGGSETTPLDTFEADPFSQAVPAASPASGLTEGEMPDWLKAMKPVETPQTQTPAADPVMDLAEGEMPDWLKSMKPIETSQAQASTPIPESASEITQGEMPDWLASIKPVETPQEPAPTPVAEKQEDIPDFLRAAGWGASTGAFDESKSAFIDDDNTNDAPLPTTGKLEEGDLPDWIKAMKPAESSSAQPAQSAVEKEEELPDWISKIGAGSPAAASEVPDWLKPNDASSTTSSTVPVNDQPDWLSALGNEPHETTRDTPASSALDFSEPMKNEQPSQPTPEPAKPAVDLSNLGAQDLDDSFAWLEALAAKQGATEGLLIKPEERLEAEPDWVKQAKNLNADTPPAPPSTPEPSPALASGASVDQTQGKPSPVPQAESKPQPVAPTASKIEDLGNSAQDSDDAFAWLEALAAKQGATEGLLIKPEERLDNAPDWVNQAKEIGDQQPAASPEPEPVAQENSWLNSIDQEEVKPPVAADETAMWLKGLEETEAKPSAASASVTADWLKSLDEDDAKPSAAQDTASWLKSLDEPELPAAQPTPAADLPSWLQNLDADPSPSQAESNIPEREAERSSWVEPVMESPKEEVASDLPSWLSEEEPKPVAAPDDLPSWLRDDTGEVVAEPTKIEPTRASDWQPVQEPKSAPREKPVEKPAPKAEKPKLAPVSKPKRSVPPKKAEPDVYREPVTRRATGMLSTASDPVLNSARAELTRSNIPGALDTYAKLIKRGRYLDEVIFDLRDALYRYPVEVTIWQSLGDAYMRANRLQDALDAYTKAEELLR